MKLPDPNVARFRVDSFAGWSDHVGRKAPFFSLGDALDFASALDAPLVDVIDLDAGRVRFARRLVPFPLARVDANDPFVPRDDFPKGAS